jgi:branched-chain amino acid aminotransferase
METLTEIQVTKTSHSKINSLNWDHLEFGKYVSDHMFLCHYQNGDWCKPQIIPVQDLSISPIALGLHYGQSIFEGMKAFGMEDGRLNIFRMEKHHERLNRTMERMCMPEIPFDLFSTALARLVQVDNAWVPRSPGSALYLRPFVFASEAKFGVKISEEYQFVIVTGPVSPLYQKPIKVKVERKFIRAAKGGTGYAKCAGNYGGAFYPTQLAREEGFDALLWTDASAHEFFEESGTMNLMFVIDGKLITPPVSETILDGVTRDSLLQIAKDLGITFEERPISVFEVKKALTEKRITEAFGAGTAAVVAPIGEIGIDGDLYQLPEYQSTSTMFRLKKALEDIRTGKAEDVHDWNYLFDAS